MGGIISNPPPGDGGSGGPNIPVPDFVSQAKQTAAGLTGAGFWGDLWARFWGAFALGWAVLARTIISLVDAWVSLVVDVFSGFQGTNTAGFFALIASIVGDLLGAEVSASDMQAAYKQHGPQAGVRAIGKTVFDNLYQSWGGTPPITPAGGLAAAQGFMGFLIEFSVRQGNIAFLQSLFPADWLEGVREYGEGIAANLGLGRLARRAFQPLVTVAISDPLTKYLNAQYLPTAFSPGEAVRAYNRGLITLAQFNQEMSWHGYDATHAGSIQVDALTQLGVADLFALYRWGQIGLPDIKAALLRNGYDPAVTDRAIASEQAKYGDTALSTFLSDLRSQRANQFIDAPTFASILDTLPVVDPFKSWYKQAVGQQLEFPKRRATLAEMQSAYADGMVDLGDIDNFLTLEGYDLLSHQIIALQTIEKLADAAQADKVKQFKYNIAVAKAAAAGKPIPPPPVGVNPLPGFPPSL